jgi:hypothetical protein
MCNPYCVLLSSPISVLCSSSSLEECEQELLICFQEDDNSHDTR